MKLLFGNESYFIEQEIKKIANAVQTEPLVFNQEDSLEKIITEIFAISIFSEFKLIVIKNHPVFTDVAQARKFIGELRQGEISKEIEIIFVWEEETLPKSELIEFLKTKAEVKEFQKVSSRDIVSTIKQIVTEKGGEISNSAAIKLAAKLPDDMFVIVSEIEKLIIENKSITNEMVEVSVSDAFKDDYFALSNALTSSDVYGILMAYKVKKENDTDPTFIIGQINSVLSLVLQVDAYHKQGLSNQNISDILKIHVFRIKKASELLAASSIEIIKNLTSNLAKLDLDIKTGQIEPNFGLENFILEVIR